jgi:hypothetical protein
MKSRVPLKRMQAIVVAAVLVLGGLALAGPTQENDATNDKKGLVTQLSELTRKVQAQSEQASKDKAELRKQLEESDAALKNLIAQRIEAYDKSRGDWNEFRLVKVPHTIQGENDRSLNMPIGAADVDFREKDPTIRNVRSALAMIVGSKLIMRGRGHEYVGDHEILTIGQGVEQPDIKGTTVHVPYYAMFRNDKEMHGEGEVTILIVANVQR